MSKKYSMDMENEKKPNVKMLLPEGWREFKLANAEEQTSKAGNPMIVITAEDRETGYCDTWYAITTAGKRWFLKLILESCKCDAAEDGKYDFDLSDIIGKNVQGLSVHEDNEWINREGETITTKQHKIVDIRECEQNAVDETIAWDEK